MFGGHLRLRDYQTNTVVIIWLDAKHTNAKKDVAKLAPAEITDLRTKLEDLANSLPTYKHLLLVVTNRHYDHDSTAINDNMCIIARDGLTFGMSPWFSLVAQVGFNADQEPTKNNLFFKC